LTSRGWVDPVPDPLLLIKSGSAGDRIRDLCICSQKLATRPQRRSHHYTYQYKILNFLICLDITKFLRSWLRQTEVPAKCRFWWHIITKAAFFFLLSLFLGSMFNVYPRLYREINKWQVTLFSGYGIKLFCTLPEPLPTFCGHFSFIAFIFGWGNDTFCGSDCRT